MEVKEIQPIAVVMPELIIYKTLKSIFQIVRDDYNNYEEADTILFQLFGLDECGNRMSWEQFDYYEQAKEIFINKPDSVQINLGYNMEVSDVACIHIMLPNESGKPLGIGADENYLGYAEQHGNQEVSQAIFTQMFDANYNMVITSENTLEVLIIYHFLKGALISLHAHIGLSGLRLPKISGQDIQLQSDLVAPHLFHRALGLSFTYEVHVPDIMRKRLIKDFNVTGIKLSNQNEDLSC